MFSRLLTSRTLACANIPKQFSCSATKSCSIDESSRVEDLPMDNKKVPNKLIRRRNYRFAYPEFLPDPNRLFRNSLREKLEREDMIARREHVNIPEFYVGSIVAVTTSRPQVEGQIKDTRFVGIVIDRGGTGLRGWILVRNVIENVGVEMMFDLYSPNVKEVEVLRLEKRLDDELYYLRDCDPKYSTFPVNMTAELMPDDQPVPINDIVLPLGPKPHTKRWERYTDRLKGYTYDINEMYYHKRKDHDAYYKYLNTGWQNEYLKYDLMRDYFITIPLEEQDQIWSHVAPDLERREAIIKRTAGRQCALRARETRREDR